MRLNFRQQYDEQRDEIERARTDIECIDPSLTQQHHAEDADINILVHRFGITDGAIPPAAIDPKYFGDFTDAIDFRTALDRVHEAQERFADLPADLRNRFNNDPADLFQWVNDERNADRAVELGLLSRAATLPVQPAATPEATPPAPPTTT